MIFFKDRKDAGIKLSGKLTKYADRNDVIVLALPRGGVPVAYEVALNLNLPLDVFLVRKLGVPGHEELAMGAIATGEIKVLNKDIISMMNIRDSDIDKVASRELLELHRREKSYRGSKSFPDLENKTVILIDDGLATGASMQAAVEALRELNPLKIVVAVPTSSKETCEKFEHEVDEIICAVTPEMFRGVGQWYINFNQTTDEEVKELLSKAKEKIS